MPLSRHFYALDDVQAAIIYTGSRGVPQETAFWCRELVESGCVAEAIAALFESWLWHRAPFGMDWLVEAQGRLGGSEVTEEDVLCVAAKLSRLPKKDHSLWWLFVREGEDIDRVTPRSPPGLAEWIERGGGETGGRGGKSMEEREVFFLRALYQGKARSAWWAGEGIPLKRWWELVEEYTMRCVSEEKREWKQRGIEALRAYEGLIGYSSEEYDRAIRGCSVLWLCIRVEEGPPSKNRVERTLDLPPLGRSLPLPHLGLYGMSRRGQMSQKETTVGDLWDVVSGMKGCPYWDERQEMATLNGESMDSYFPMDLPDEWKREEKEKSHGVGLLREGEFANLWGYTKRYMMGLCRGVWMAGPMAAIQERLEQVILPEGVSPFHALLRMFSSCPGPVGLLPVHKKRVVRSGR